MHIIKITPQSFKIILTNDELIRGKDEFCDISDDMFRHIIEETNRLYGNPFDRGTIDAEFFASKDGGGELFISLSKQNENMYLAFTSKSSDDLLMLCRRLAKSSGTYKSTLYYGGGEYTLVIMCEGGGFLLSLLKEYGNARRISPLSLWVLDEHAKKIVEGNAVGTIAHNS
jgi:hypothetical protein